MVSSCCGYTVLSSIGCCSSSATAVVVEVSVPISSSLFVCVTGDVVVSERDGAYQDGGPGFNEVEHVEAIFDSLAYLYAFCISDYFPLLVDLDLDGHEKIVKNTNKTLKKYHDLIVEDRLQKWRHENCNKEKELEDLLDVLITLHDDEGNPLLTPNEIKAQITEIMIAAIDNPPNAVEWTLAEMINNLNIMDKAVKELDRVVGKKRLIQESHIPQLNYLKACIRESFRLHPIVPFNVPHVTLSDMTVAGYFIPKGRRGCITSSLGTSMTMMLIARLLQGFTWHKPQNFANIELVESRDNLFLERPLMLHPQPRLPLYLTKAEMTSAAESITNAGADEADEAEDESIIHQIASTFSKVVRSWASKKFMTGCVILFPLAVTFYVTWWLIITIAIIDKEVQRDMKLVPYKIVNKDGKKIKDVVVTVLGNYKTVIPI
ncbi:hypothetical protein ACFE04_001893 [Oxalis oulophora]